MQPRACSGCGPSQWGRRLEGWPNTTARLAGWRRVTLPDGRTVHAAYPDGPHHWPWSWADLLLTVLNTPSWATVRQARNAWPVTLADPCLSLVQLFINVHFARIQNAPCNVASGYFFRFVIRTAADKKDACTNYTSSYYLTKELWDPWNVLKIVKRGSFLYVHQRWRDRENVKSVGKVRQTGLNKVRNVYVGTF